MKDCFGTPLLIGDEVVVVVPMAPIRHRQHMVGTVTCERGLRVGIRFLDSDYGKGIRYVLPDGIQKRSTWVKVANS